MKHLRKVVVGFLVGAAMLLLGGCAQFGLAPAQSLSQQIAYGYGTVTTVRQSATTALQAGAITVETAQKVLTVTDDARSALDAAQAAVTSGDAATASSVMATATSLLLQAQSLLPAAVKTSFNGSATLPIPWHGKSLAIHTT